MQADTKRMGRAKGEQYNEGNNKPLMGLQESRQTDTIMLWLL